MIPLPIQPHLLESMTSRTSSSRRSVGIPGGWCLAQANRLFSRSGLALHARS